MPPCEARLGVPSALSTGKHLWREAGGQRLDHTATADDADQQIGNDQPDQAGKKQQTDEVTVETIAEELDLSRVTVLASELPNADADQEKTQRVNDTAAAGQHPVNADTFLVSFAAAAHERERRHRRSEQTHQQHERADRMTGDLIVFLRALEQTA